MPSRNHLWRKGSLFTAPTVFHLSIDERRLYIARVHLCHRAGAIARSGKDLGLLLLTYLGVNGQIYPSQETLARGIACKSVKTIQRELGKLQACKLVDWQQRMERRPGSWQATQVTNSYVLNVPRQWTAPTPKARKSPGRHFAAATPSLTLSKKKEGVAPVSHNPGFSFVDHAAVARIRQQREAADAAEYHRQRQEKWLRRGAASRPGLP